MAKSGRLIHPRGNQYLSCTSPPSPFSRQKAGQLDAYDALADMTGGGRGHDKRAGLPLSDVRDQQAWETRSLTQTC